MRSEMGKVTAGVEASPGGERGGEKSAAATAA